MILADDRADFYLQLSLEIKKAIISTFYKNGELIDKPDTLNSEVEQIRKGMMQAFVGEKIDTRTYTQTGIAMLLRYKIYPDEKAKKYLVLKEELKKLFLIM